MTPDDAARYAASSIGNASDGIHGAVPALVHDLIELGSGPRAPDVNDAWLTAIGTPLVAILLRVD